MDSLENGGKTISFEMDLHVPCRITGITKNGSRWDGEATTLSISSFGAHLLLPAETELEGDIVLTFRVPPALATLFVRKKFRVRAEMKPSGAVGPSSATMGRKVVCVVFTERLKFRLRDAKGKT